MNEINAYIYYHEYDYGKNNPVLVIQGDFGSNGYDVNTETGELTRTCICFAYTDSECVCGYFDSKV
jgi:hypothetical protein